MRPFLFAALALSLVTSAAHADCSSDFNAIIKHGREIGPYQTDDTVSIGDMHVTTTMQVILPDAIHMKIAAPKGDQELILTGGQGWANVKGFWLSLPDNDAKTLLGTITQSGVLFANKIDKLECLGRKTIEGKDYLAFKYEAGISNFTVPMTAYADPATNLPVKAEGSTDSGGVTANFSTTYKSDPALKIVPPLKP